MVIFIKCFEYSRVAYPDLAIDETIIMVCLFFLQIKQFSRYPARRDLRTRLRKSPLLPISVFYSAVFKSNHGLFVLKLILRIRRIHTGTGIFLFSSSFLKKLKRKVIDAWKSSVKNQKVGFLLLFNYLSTKYELLVTKFTVGSPVFGNKFAPKNKVGPKRSKSRSKVKRSIFQMLLRWSCRISRLSC